jgi:16S rRNA (uracil1498-N3)-methyltransferase
MQLFYAPRISGEFHELDEQESRHAVRVLRLSKGEKVVLVDGTGGWYECEIAEAHPKRCRLEIRTRTPDHNPLPYDLHIGISPTRSTDRFEWFLEKATEIGISEITPLICHRTERSRLNYERLQRIIVSAMKQSLRAYKPALSEPVRFDRFLKGRHSGTLGIAHCQSGDRISLEELKPSGRYTLLIGPEGDFTDDEIDSAVSAGYIPFHLGESRLRTETAGIYVCSVVRSVLSAKTSDF